MSMDQGEEGVLLHDLMLLLLLCRHSLLLLLLLQQHELLLWLQQLLHGLPATSDVRRCCADSDEVPWRARVLVLRLPGDVVDVVGSELGGLDPLPAGGEALLLQRVRPVRSLGVVVDEVLAAAAEGEADGPAQGEGQLGLLVRLLLLLLLLRGVEL